MNSEVQRLTAACLAHRGCCGTEHDPPNGKLHGHCVVCGVPWPCDTAKSFMPIVAPAEAAGGLKIIVERLLELVEGRCPDCGSQELHSASLNSHEAVSCGACDWIRSYQQMREEAIEAVGA